MSHIDSVKHPKNDNWEVTVTLGDPDLYVGAVDDCSVQAYTFDLEAERDAFILGIQTAIGWQQYSIDIDDCQDIG